MYNEPKLEWLKTPGMKKFRDRRQIYWVSTVHACNEGRISDRLEILSPKLAVYQFRLKWCKYQQVVINGLFL